MLGFFIEYSYSDIPEYVVDISIIISAITYLINSVYFYVNEKSDIYKYVILVEFTCMYIIAAILASNWVFFISLPMIVICTIYGETKFLIISGVVQNLATIYSCIYKVMTMPEIDNPRYFAAIYITIVSVHIVVTVIIIRTSKMLGFVNAQKRMEMIEKQQNMKVLSMEVLDVGKSINNMASNTSNIIEQIEQISQEMCEKYIDISKKNIENSVSAREQDNMSTRITDMIGYVDLEVERAKETTKDSKKSIKMSKESIEQLKEKSQLILEHNKEVALSFNTLLKNIKGINGIITGIFEISEQTNLLSLNAYIESAKAGDNRKNFEVVASQISSLSETTLELMWKMKIIISNLHSSSIKVRNVIAEIMGLVDNENVVIDNTMDGLDKIGDGITMLSESINNISSKVEQVLEHSKIIGDSSNKIASFSNKIEESTSKVLAMNEENQGIIKRTKEVIIELDSVAEELSVYQ